MCRKHLTGKNANACCIYDAVVIKAVDSDKYNRFLSLSDSDSVQVLFHFISGNSTANQPQTRTFPYRTVLYLRDANFSARDIFMGRSTVHYCNKKYHAPNYSLNYVIPKLVQSSP